MNKRKRKKKKQTKKKQNECAQNKDDFRPFTNDFVFAMVMRGPWYLQRDCGTATS